ncbi:hypothetical protein BHC49_02620 [Snodgrassella alvi]|uniref:Uncharacterized protein n=1 Tax=Snodgrassella alvi TaxID=1196083 RepID=A0A2N9Y059_9NEIS|nr:hypothetical protein BHC49_02620 [Snodgrassella alvi]
MVPVAVAAAFVAAACILTPVCNKSWSDSWYGLYQNINSSFNVSELRFPSLSEDISNGEKCEVSTVEVNNPNNSSGTGAVPPPPDDPDKNNKSKNSNKYTKHGKMTKEQARTDKHRQVGDVNRVKREGKLYRDSQTGNNVYVSGNRVVIETPKGEHVTRWTNTRANTNMRIRKGKWVRKWED